MAHPLEYKPIPDNEEIRGSTDQTLLPDIEDTVTCHCSSTRRHQRQWTWARRIGCHIGVAAIYMSIIGIFLAHYLPQRHDSRVHHSYSKYNKL